MSLILDALRKSEAERRRARAPDLFADTAPAAAAPSRSALPAWPWIAAGVLAVALVAWAVGNRLAGGDDASATRDDAAPAASHDVADGEARGVVADAPAADRGDRIATPTTAGAKQAPASAAASATTAPMPPPFSAASAGDGASVPSLGSSASAASIAAPLEPASVAMPGAPSSTSTPTIAAPSTAPARAAPPPALPRVDAAIAAAPAPDAALSSPSATLRLSDLSIEERQQLPALKISMLMWNADAARRFAIVDGTRVAEGDRVGAAVVAAIAEDGVVLAWQGRRLRVPIR